MHDMIVFFLASDRQSPLGHFAVTGIRQVNLPDRPSRFQRLMQGSRLQPIGIVAQQRKEPFQPSIRINMLFRLGPGSKFFAVITEHKHAARP